MPLDHVGPLMDSLEIEHVHLTPDLLGVKRLAVTMSVILSYDWSDEGEPAEYEEEK